MIECEELEQAEHERYQAYLAWSAAQGTPVPPKTAHSYAHMSPFLGDPFGLRRIAAENGDPNWEGWGVKRRHVAQ